MFDIISQFLDSAGHNVAIVIAVVFAAAVAESALGLGAILPGETVLVLAAVAVGHQPALALAVVAAAAGAFVGDHIGFGLGRRLGDKMAGTAAVRAIGRHRWDAATGFVARRGFWVIVVARLLPGVRTLISAAAGASPLSYRRFALATGTASLAWSLLWVVGGGTLGIKFLSFAEQATLPALGILAAAGVGGLLLRRTFRRASAARARRLRERVASTPPADRTEKAVARSGGV